MLWNVLLIAISSLTFIVLVVVHGYFYGYIPSGQDHTDWGLFGDYVGGVGGTILAFYTVVILIQQNMAREKETHLAQRKEDLQDNYSFFIQNLAEHRKIISELSMHVHIKKQEMTFYGTEVLKYLFEHHFATSLARAYDSALKLPNRPLIEACVQNLKLRNHILPIYKQEFPQLLDRIESGEAEVWVEMFREASLVDLWYNRAHNHREKMYFLEEVYGVAAMELDLEENLTLMRSAFMDFFHDWGDLLHRYFNNQNKLLEHIYGSDFPFERVKIVGLLRSFMSSYEMIFLYYYYQSTYTNADYNMMLKEYHFFENLDLLPFCGRVFYRRFGYETLEADFFI